MIPTIFCKNCDSVYIENGNAKDCMECRDEESINIDTHRAEAIRHIKKIDEALRDDGISFMGHSGYGGLDALNALREYIIWNNNLIEGDLK